MTLFSDKIRRSQKGTDKLYISLCEQKERGILNDFTIETVNGQEVWNIVGSLEVKSEDLVEGKLPVKIGVLTGDMILYTRDYDESIIPNQLGGEIIFKDNELIEEKNGETLLVIDSKNIDWEERHFQICLALLSRPEIGVRGTTNDPQMPMIIKRADKMVELLKEHYAESSKNK